MDFTPRRTRMMQVLLIVVLGSGWGAIEMSLGGFLHFIHFPLKGVVLGGVGLAWMVLFVYLTRRPGLVIWLGLVAASYKLLDAILLGISPASPAVINPATAIVLEALTFRMVAAILLRRRNVKAMVETGLLTILCLGILLFHGRA